MANVFISHSSADKSYFVQPLVTALQERGHVVWYDIETIRLGDSITSKLSEGLEKAERAIVVISQAFLDSEWCQRELAALIMGHTNHAKDLTIVRLDEAPVPGIITDIHRLELRSGDSAGAAHAIQRVLEHLDREVTSRDRRGASLGGDLVARILAADARSQFGVDLLPAGDPGGAGRPENEGLLLVKPGGTMHEPCLAEIVRRISNRCTICQVRVYDGKRIERHERFDRQYVTSVRLASGAIALTDDDQEKIRAIYDHPEFSQIYGVTYADDLIVPALTLTGRGIVTARQLSALWEEARASRFHTRRPDGLNKIGYQKSVCPLDLPGVGVRLVLNGFLPGYRELFVSAASRVVAIHVSSELPWQRIRDHLVGGESDPKACPAGSIRRDALDGKIPLDPTDPLVNGQRNVCHSSATLLDGMRELRVWFDYDSRETVVGRVCELSGVSPDELEAYTEHKLPDVSWFTRGEDLRQLVFDVRLHITKQNLRGSTQYRKRVDDYARIVDDRRDLSASLAHQPRLEAFVTEGLRLRQGGHALYQHAISEMFGADRESRATFFEVARRIEALAQSANPEIGCEVVAAAYRIAAGDLMLLRSPVYRTLDSPLLFRHAVVAALPAEALACAARTERNVVRDLRGTYAVESRDVPTPIEEHPSWHDPPLARAKPAESGTIAIVLCGGRSTRTASTIPKPVLPLRGRLLVNYIVATIRSATNGDVDVIAAVGFRADLIRTALGDHVQYLEDSRTLGLGFRVAAALDALSAHTGRVLIVYADMPDIAISTIARLLESVDGPRTFALVESQSDALSGHIIRRGASVERIVQSRLAPPPTDFHTRDVGAYAFFNSPSFRRILGSLSNDNVRGEYMFADVVGALVEHGWTVNTVVERPELARGVNTSAELLELAGDITPGPGGGAVELAAIAGRLNDDYGLDIAGIGNARALKAAIADHSGPVHFFNWWDGYWT